MSQITNEAFNYTNAKAASSTQLTNLSTMHTTAVDASKSLNSILTDKKVSSMDNLVSRLHATAGLAYKATSEIEKLTVAVAAYNQAVGAAGGMKFNFVKDKDPNKVTPVGTPGDKTKEPKKDKDLVDQFLDKSAFFMFRYRMYSAAFDAAQYSVKDLLLGGSRQKLAKDLGELSGLQFTSGQKKQTEYAAMMFSMKFWQTSTEEYVKAMSMTASAFDINSIGFENLRRMNEAVLKFGSLSKLGAEKSAELLSGVVLSIVSRLPQETRDALNKGLTADVKGYGNTDLGGMVETIAARSAKAVQISSLWGPGIASAFKYMLPELLEKGWDVTAALSMLGALKNQNFRPEQIGRATKDLFLSTPTAFAKAYLMANNLWEEGGVEGSLLSEGDANKINKMRTAKLGDWITKNLFSDPDMFMAAMPVLGESVRKAEEKGKRFVEDMGFSKYFASVLRQFMEPGTMDEFKKFKAIIASAEYDDLAKMMVEQIQDAGTAWERITGAFNRFYQAAADSPVAHQIAGPIADFMNYQTLYLQIPKTLRTKGNETLADAMKDFDKNYRGTLEAMYGKEAVKKMTDGISASYKQGDWTVLFFGAADVWKKLSGLDFDTESYWESWKSVGELFVSIGKSLDWLNQTPVMLKQLISELFPQLGEMEDYIVSQMVKVKEFFERVIDSIVSLIYSIPDLIMGKIGIGLPGKTDSVNASQGGWWDSFTDSLSGAKNWFLGLPSPAQAVAVQDNVDTTIGKSILENPESLPSMFAPKLPGYTPLSGVPMQLSDASDQPIHIENRLIVDGRELAYIISEIIQRNRAVNYQGFGGDPFGYNTGIG